MQAGMSPKRISPATKAATAISLAAETIAGAVPPGGERPVGQPQAGEPLGVGPLEGQRRSARRAALAA